MTRVATDGPREPHLRFVRIIMAAAPVVVTPGSRLLADDRHPMPTQRSLDSAAAEVNNGFAADMAGARLGTRRPRRLPGGRVALRTVRLTPKRHFNSVSDRARASKPGERIRRW